MIFTEKTAPIRTCMRLAFCFFFFNNIGDGKIKNICIFAILITKLKLYENRRSYEEIVTCAGNSVSV